MLYVVKAYRLCLVEINCKNTVKLGYRWRREKVLESEYARKKSALECMSIYMTFDKRMGCQTKYKYTLLTKKGGRKHGKR